MLCSRQVSHQHVVFLSDHNADAAADSCDLYMEGVELKAPHLLLLLALLHCFQLSRLCPGCLYKIVWHSEHSFEMGCGRKKCILKIEPCSSEHEPLERHTGINTCPLTIIC